MKRARRPRRQWSPEEKNQIVREFERSGLSVSAFAGRQQLSITSLRSWIDRFGAGEPGKAAFVEVKGLLPEDDRGDYHYELTLTSGHKLRLRRGFDSHEVQTLAAALGSHA